MLFVALVIGILLFVIFISLYFRAAIKDKTKSPEGDDEDIEILKI